MINFKKMAIGFGLVSIITLQGLQANKPPECRFFFPYTNGSATAKRGAEPFILSVLIRFILLL